MVEKPWRPQGNPLTAKRCAQSEVIIIYVSPGARAIQGYRAKDLTQRMLLSRLAKLPVTALPAKNSSGPSLVQRAIFHQMTRFR
jgi:hypothetical protein